MNMVLTPPSENNGNVAAASTKSICPNKYFFKLQLIPAVTKERPDFWPEITKDLYIYREVAFMSAYPFNKQEQKLDEKATAEKTNIEYKLCDVHFHNFYSNIYSEIKAKVKKLNETIHPQEKIK